MKRTEKRAAETIIVMSYDFLAGGISLTTYWKNLASFSKNLSELDTSDAPVPQPANPANKDYENTRTQDRP